MTLGEQLLNLTVEYHASVKSRDSRHDEYAGMGDPVGREPAEIAADYETLLRSTLSAELPG